MMKLQEVDTVIQPKLEDDTKDRTAPVWMMENKELYGDSSDVLSQEFLKKYIHFAKKQYNPVLTEEGVGFVAESYKQMRQKTMDPTAEVKMPITVRSLETLIRLGTAHAKL